jgi:Mg-chelatase subunit ChlD
MVWAALVLLAIAGAPIARADLDLPAPGIAEGGERPTAGTEQADALRAAAAPLPPDLPWVELLAPESQVVSGAPALVDVRGRAGRGPRAALDVVLVLDVSASTLLASGLDVDGDGVIAEPSPRGTRNAYGELRPHRTWTTDPGDTVMAAELLAARRLLERLDAAHTRVGIVTFAGRARRKAHVGALSDALAALDQIRPALDISGTNLGAAVRLAAALLERAERRDGGAARKAILVLSDGDPTVPHPAYSARSYAVRAAEWAAERNIAVHGFAVGEPSVPHVLAEMANASHGAFIRVYDIAGAVAQMPYADLAGIDRVTMWNRTARAPGRAVRLFADGSFDGLVPLVTGTNVVEVTVRSEEGTVVRRHCTVYYNGAAPEDAERALDLRRTLRLRTEETELAARARAARRAPDVRSVEVFAKP